MSKTPEHNAAAWVGLPKQGKLSAVALLRLNGITRTKKKDTLSKRNLKRDTKIAAWALNQENSVKKHSPWHSTALAQLHRYTN